MAHNVACAYWVIKGCLVLEGEKDCCMHATNVITIMRFERDAVEQVDYLAANSIEYHNLLCHAVKLLDMCL